MMTITVEEFQQTDEWCDALDEAEPMDASDSGLDYPNGDFDPTNVQEVLASAHGPHPLASWLAILRVDDGRIALLERIHRRGEWESTITSAANLEDILRVLTPRQRVRLATWRLES